MKLSDNKMILGVCAGIAEYFGCDITLVRVITVILFCFGTVGLWAYLIVGLIMYLSNR